MVRHNYRAIKTGIELPGTSEVWEVRWYRIARYPQQVGKIVKQGQTLFIAAQKDGTQIGSPSDSLKEARAAVVEWHKAELRKQTEEAARNARQKRKETRNRYNAAREQTQRMIKAQDGKCVWGLDVFTYDDRKRDESRGEAPFLRAFIFEQGGGEFYAMRGYSENKDGWPDRLRFERTDFNSRAELFEYIRMA